MCPAIILLSLLSGQALGRISHMEGAVCSSAEEVRSVVDEVVPLALDCGSRAAALARAWGGPGQLLVALRPGPGAGHLGLCVDRGEPCVPSPGPVTINMTAAARTFTVRLAAEGPGILCLRQAAVYQRGDRLLLPAKLVSSAESEEEGSLGYIPDRYTEIIVLEEQIGEKMEEHAREEIQEEKHDREGEEGPVVLANSRFDSDVDALVAERWQEVSVVTRERESKVLTRGGNFSRVLVLLGLAAANWMVGTGIEWRALGSPAAGLASMGRQCSFLAPLLSLQPWKVGLLCQAFLLPFLSYGIAQLAYRPGLSCSGVTDLSRLGLFLLATGPGNTTAIYFAELWDGDLQLSVALVILSTLLSPLTYLLWWNTLGRVLLSGPSSAEPVVPIENILELISIMILPVFIGMYMASKLPTLKEFMKSIRKPIIVVGLIGCIIIYYFQYAHFFQFFSFSDVLACGLFSFASFSLAALAGLSCRFSRPEVISLAIDCCMRNGTLTFAIVRYTFKPPRSFYVEIPASAQVLFTTVPIVAAWLVHRGGRWVLRQCRKVGGPAAGPGPAVVPAGLEMVRISDIKEAWCEQHNLRPLWC
jgi:predicted Na+-dependent transporter